MDILFTLFHQMNGIVLVKHTQENMTMNKIQAVYTALNIRLQLQPTKLVDINVQNNSTMPIKCTIFDIISLNCKYKPHPSLFYSIPILHYS